jgi:UDP-glucose 4-epimerase
VRALVTGGAGFIGSHLAEALLRDGADVVVLDDLSTGALANVPRDAKLVEGDVAESDDVVQAIAGCDVVFHQAALGSVVRSVDRPLDTDRANVHGTLALLTEARQAGVRRVVLASSSSVYGGAQQLPTPEDAPLLPRSPYAVSKLTGEHYARVAWELHGLETVCLRYFNVFGPRQRPDGLYTAVIPRFVRALMAGTPPRIDGDGSQSRDFTFVDDVVQANLQAAVAPAARCGGRAYNVAWGQPHDLRQLLDVIQGELGTRIEPVHTARRRGDVEHSHADISAARRDLGYEPAVPFERGVVQTVAWFRRALA